MHKGHNINFVISMKNTVTIYEISCSKKKKSKLQFRG